METPLKACDPDEAWEHLSAAVGVLLGGVRSDQLGLMGRAASESVWAESWGRFVSQTLLPVKRLIVDAYQAAAENQMEGILSANLACHSALVMAGEARERGHALALGILATSKGARSERQLSRLADHWGGSDAGLAHPAVSVAVKAACFHESFSAALAAYYCQEWRASRASFLQGGRSSVTLFLDSQQTELLTLSPASLHDPDSPFSLPVQQQS